MQDLRFHVILKSGLLTILFFLPYFSHSTSVFTSSDKFIIVIDAGHGGKDIGTSGEYLIEKDATLTLAMELGQMLSEINQRIEIRYTRDTDKFLPIYRRVAYANENRADLFISIHCNAVAQHSPHGIETYVLGIQNNEENLETVKRENESILHEENINDHYSGFDPNSPTGHIFLSAVQNKYINEGILLAHQIQIQFSDRNLMRDRGVKQAGFVVLKKATMPAILLEVGFLSNRNDETKLVNKDSRSKIVSHISDGINSYVKKIQSSNSPTIEKQTVLNIPSSVQPANIVIKAEPKVTFDIVLASSVGLEMEAMIDSEIDNKKVISHLEDGMYKYTIGPYLTLAEAINMQNELRLKNYKGAFVIKSKKNAITASNQNDIQIKFAGVN